MVTPLHVIVIIINATATNDNVTRTTMVPAAQGTKFGGYLLEANSD
jgi:hypothetical protein